MPRAEGASACPGRIQGGCNTRWAMAGAGGIAVSKRRLDGSHEDLLTILVGICMLATLGVMLAGMLGLARSDGNAKRSNR